MLWVRAEWLLNSNVTGRFQRFESVLSKGCGTAARVTTGHPFSACMQVQETSLDIVSVFAGAGSRLEERNVLGGAIHLSKPLSKPTRSRT